MEKLSSSLEDYLEVIYNFFENKQKVRAIDISRELSVSRASVSEALKRLAEKDFINYGRYETLSLTQAGKNYALEVLAKHNSIQKFFEEILGAEHDEACENACKIEHVISKDILKRIVAFTEFAELSPEFFEKFKTFYQNKTK